MRTGSTRPRWTCSVGSSIGCPACALLVVTFRPEFAAPWVGRAHVASLQLNRFGRRQAMAMVDRVTGGKALPAEVLEQIVAKTDGVPLFVEELTKTVLESGLLREEDGGYVLASALTPLAIPSTLQDSLMARLDRLAPVKGNRPSRSSDRARVSLPAAGSCVADPRRGVGGRPRPTHGGGADPRARRAAGSDLCLQARARAGHSLRLTAAEPSPTHTCRHRTGAGGEVRRSGRSGAAAIAHHYTEAGLADPAARYWLAASELALSRSAYAEADRYVDAGLALIPRLPQGTDRQSLELALHVARATALSPLKAYTAPETVAAFRAAKRLLDAGVGDDSQRFFVLIGLYMTPYMAGAIGVRARVWRASSWKPQNGRTKRIIVSWVTAWSP